MTLLDVALILIALGLAVSLAAARRQNRQLRDNLAKQAEQAERLEDFQRSAESRLDALIDAPPHVLLVLDQDGAIMRANSRATEMLGTAVIGRTVIDATRSHEIDAVVQSTLGQQRSEERPVTWNARPYFARAVPISDGGAVLALEDQADRLRLERVRRDFVANVSHELRTPLASVRLLIETLLNGALEEPEMATRMLNQMLSEVDSITQLAQELLDLSMIESGQMPMQVTRANLHEIVDEQIIHYEPLAQQKHLSVEDNVPIDVIVEVDRKMIGRVLGNLIHNAIKFTPDRGRISIGAVVGRRQDHSQRGRYRRGHSRRGSAAHLRTVLQSGSRARQERHGVGVSHCAPRGGSARRPHLGRKRGRQRRDVLLHAACSKWQMTMTMPSLSLSFVIVQTDSPHLSPSQSASVPPHRLRSSRAASECAHPPCAYRRDNRSPTLAAAAVRG